MKIKYRPIYTGKTTEIEKIDEYTIKIDGEEYEFSNQDGDYPKISEETDGLILSAKVEDSVLWLEVKREYSDEEKPIWENPSYYDDGGYRGSKWEEL